MKRYIIGSIIGLLLTAWILTPSMTFQLDLGLFKIQVMAINPLIPAVELYKFLNPVSLDNKINNDVPL